MKRLLIPCALSPCRVDRGSPHPLVIHRPCPVHGSTVNGTHNSNTATRQAKLTTGHSSLVVAELLSPPSVASISIVAPIVKADCAPASTRAPSSPGIGTAGFGCENFETTFIAGRCFGHRDPDRCRWGSSWWRGRVCRRRRRGWIGGTIEAATSASVVHAGASLPRLTVHLGAKLLPVTEGLGIGGVTAELRCALLNKHYGQPEEQLGCQGRRMGCRQEDPCGAAAIHR